MKTRIVLLFLLLNFGALALGGLFTGKGVPSDWYLSLAKAPWTPPGWVFGAAWTVIMVTFTFYLASVWPTLENKQLFIGLYAVQWVLNVIWNPLFFHFHFTTIALVAIVALTITVFVFLFMYLKPLGWKSALVLPYAIWLIIATSLNWYIVLNN